MVEVFAVAGLLLLAELKLDEAEGVLEVDPVGFAGFAAGLFAVAEELGLDAAAAGAGLLAAGALAAADILASALGAVGAGVLAAGAGVLAPVEAGELATLEEPRGGVLRRPDDGLLVALDAELELLLWELLFNEGTGVLGLEGADACVLVGVAVEGLSFLSPRPGEGEGVLERLPRLGEGEGALELLLGAGVKEEGLLGALFLELELGSPSKLPRPEDSSMALIPSSRNEDRSSNKSSDSCLVPVDEAVVGSLVSFFGEVIAGFALCVCDLYGEVFAND